MKKGTIVYLADAGSIPADADLEDAARQEGLDPEWTEFAASVPGYHRLPEALLALAARGAGRVELASATLAPGGSLRLSPALHLRG